MSVKQVGKDYIGVGCGALIVNEKNEVLLTRRSGKARNEVGYWSKPGGTVEYGEKIIDATVREIKEELNIDIEIIGYLPHVDHILEEEGQHWVAFNVIAKIVGGYIKNMEPDKCDAVEWFPINALPEKITQTTQGPVDFYRAGNFIKL
ncbi:MAG: DNA mismatch repair protein MutT [Candidatus Moraniibacteriota bacterium]|nr:MAG: DNA mismatch repair protein MutT [Candidatus Moranbacteria bacterium]